METIQISKSEARALYKDASADLKKRLESVYSKKDLTNNIMDRIQSYEDACADQGKDPIASLPFPDPKTDRQAAHNANEMLWTIAESLREGKDCDWENGNKKKWIPIFEYQGGSSGFGFSHSAYGYAYSGTVAGSRLSVHDEKTSDYFGKQFIALHNKVLLNNKNK